VAAHEFYCYLCCDTTTATIVGVGRPALPSRTARYWADYEYFDAQQVKHVGRAEGVRPTTSRGDFVEVQFLRRRPTDESPGDLGGPGSGMWRRRAAGGARPGD
jgi:hypothetical protein